MWKGTDLFTKVSLGSWLTPSPNVSTPSGVDSQCYFFWFFHHRTAVLIILVFSLLHAPGSLTYKLRSRPWNTSAFCQYWVILVLTEDWARSLSSRPSFPDSGSHWGTPLLLTVASPCPVYMLGMNICWIWATPVKFGLVKYLSSRSPGKGYMRSPMSTMAVSPELGSWRDWPIHALSLSLTMWEGFGPLHQGPPWSPNNTLVPLIKWPWPLTSPERLLESRPCLSQTPEEKMPLCLHSRWLHSLPYFKEHGHQRSQRSSVLISFNKLAEPVYVRIHPSFVLGHRLGGEWTGRKGIQEWLYRGGCIHGV